MDSELERMRLNRRYLTLFGVYASQAAPLVQIARDIIIQQQHAHVRLELRGDALLFMLVNLDHMVIRPCTLPLDSVPEDIARPFFTNPEDMIGRIQDLVGRIFDQLEQHAGGSTRYIVSTKEILDATGGIWDYVNSAYCPPV